MARRRYYEMVTRWLRYVDSYAMFRHAMPLLPYFDTLLILPYITPRRQLFIVTLTPLPPGGWYAGMLVYAMPCRRYRQVGSQLLTSAMMPAVTRYAMS